MIFNKKNTKEETYNLSKIGALLIHAAKIDENYSKDEKEIIENTLLELGATNNNLNSIMIESENIEKEANQILNFTREVKNMSEKEKIKIIESLWKIIYSNKDADVYETNLMRRLAGLLYIDSKIMGDIKLKIENENSK